MKNSYNKIRLLDRASLAISFVGLILTSFTHESLFALIPLSINAFIGLLRRERLEKKSKAHNSIDIEQFVDVASRFLDSIDIDKLINSINIEDFADKFSKIYIPDIKYFLEVEREQRIYPLESKLQTIDRKISNAKTEIDANLITINEKLSLIPKIDLLERLQEQHELIQEQRGLIQLVTEELQLNNSSNLMAVRNRKESREQLIKALTEAKSRLIIVCPWIRKDAINSKNIQSKTIINLIESALKRQVKIDIGWGHLNDLYCKNKGKYKQMSRENLLFSDNGNKRGMYDGLELLENLATKYPNLNLKMLGTHEKYLVCDRSYAMIGSHNFLTSGDGSDEKELGLVTWNTHIIKEIEEKFEYG